VKVFIVGITGETGIRLARCLKARGDEVGGLYRRPAQGEALREMGVTATLGDLVALDAPGLAAAMRGYDAIVYTAGSGVSDSDAMTDAIDGDGVVKSIAAAKLAGITRFLLVSVFPDAGRRRERDAGFEHYIAVKKRADVALAHSGLDWIILRPAVLKNDPGAGTVTLGPAEIYGEISRDDVAAVLAEVLRTPDMRRRILELTGGPAPIADAVAAQASAVSIA
jgi:uncharacterized protein YbjT (DUF2867 family)